MGTLVSKKEHKMQRRLYLPLLVVAALAWTGCASAQGTNPNDAVESEIRRLERAEADGLLHKDIAVLETIWAEDFTVNNPRNSISRGRNEVVALIRNGTIDYSSFVRDIEAVFFHGDTVIVMGAETITPVGKAPLAGQTVRRRFTHFWMKRNAEWRLTARHANVICGN
jgi:ketosteroid isomerase-like protein